MLSASARSLASLGADEASAPTFAEEIACVD
jgi:hypothetical protein